MPLGALWGYFSDSTLLAESVSVLFGVPSESADSAAPGSSVGALGSFPGL